MSALNPPGSSPWIPPIRRTCGEVLDFEGILTRLKSKVLASINAHIQIKSVKTLKENPSSKMFFKYYQQNIDKKCKQERGIKNAYLCL